LHIFKNPSDEFSVFKHSKYDIFSKSTKNKRPTKEKFEVSNKWSSDEEESKKQIEEKWEKDSIKLKDSSPQKNSVIKNGRERNKKRIKRVSKSPSSVKRKRHKKSKSHHRHRHRHSK